MTHASQKNMRTARTLFRQATGKQKAFKLKFMRDSKGQLLYPSATSTQISLEVSACIHEYKCLAIMWLHEEATVTLPWLFVVKQIKIQHLLAHCVTILNVARQTSDVSRRHISTALTTTSSATVPRSRKNHTTILFVKSYAFLF